MTDIARYKIGASSASIKRGDIVCLSATIGEIDQPEVVRASPGVLAAGGTVVGIAITNPLTGFVNVNVSRLLNTADFRRLADVPLEIECSPISTMRKRGVRIRMPLRIL